MNGEGDEKPLPGFENLTPAPPSMEVIPYTKQSQYHYSRLKQLNELVGIADDPNPDMGFMARLLTLCSLPRTNPGDRLQYKRQNGPYKLIMLAGGDNKLPFGNLPRLLIAWVCTEAVRTGERKLILGSSLAEFMHSLGMYSDSGGTRGDRTRLKNQIDRLFHCRIDLIYEDDKRKRTVHSDFAEETDLWWDFRQPEQNTMWQSWIMLGEKLFNEIREHPVPLDMRILKAMRRSPLGLDIYMWLSYKTHALYQNQRENMRRQQTGANTARLKETETLSWPRLYTQFGAHPERAGDNNTVQNFAKDFRRELRKLQICWRDLDFNLREGGLAINACMPSIEPQSLADKRKKRLKKTARKAAQGRG